MTDKILALAVTVFLLVAPSARAGWFDSGASTERKEAVQPTKPLTKKQIKYVCGCRGAITLLQSRIDEEKEIAKTAGVVDQARMHDWATSLVHANKYIQSVGGDSVPTSACTALKFDELQSMSYCHDGIYMMNNP